MNCARRNEGHVCPVPTQCSASSCFPCSFTSISHASLSPICVPLGSGWYFPSPVLVVVDPPPPDPVPPPPSHPAKSSAREADETEARTSSERKLTSILVRIAELLQRAKTE